SRSARRLHHRRLRDRRAGGDRIDYLGRERQPPATATTGQTQGAGRQPPLATDRRQTGRARREDRMSAAIENPAQAKPRRLIMLLPLFVFLAIAALFLYRLGAGDPSMLPSVL